LNLLNARPYAGWLSSALNELAAASRVGVEPREARIPLRPEVRGACEMLGLDPPYVAKEGKLLAVVPRPKRINSWRSCATGRWGRTRPSLARWSTIIRAW
jgi:hypothetical protein